jgi:hypothetical protein
MALAVVEDVFGPVSAPMYLLRFASQSVMEELLVKPGLSVFYPKVDAAAAAAATDLLTPCAESGVSCETR